MAESPSPFIGLLNKLTITDSSIVTIRCNDGDVKVKKSLLTTVSNVFKCMFENDFIEKRTNVVVANDIHFETMQFIIQYYENGTVHGYKKANKEGFDYNVEKYDLFGIKDDIAEKLLGEYRQGENLKLLEAYFLISNSPKSKFGALRELALIAVQGKVVPNFVNAFTVEDFTKFSEMCCDMLRQSKMDNWKSFLNIFYSWTSENPEERSIASLKILSLINLGNFPVSEVLILFENLKLGEEFKTMKLVLEKSLGSLLKVEKYDQYLKSSSIETYCKECKHCNEPPYHFSSKCKGIHRCNTCSDNYYVCCYEITRGWSHHHHHGDGCCWKDFCLNSETNIYGCSISK
ncbi:uncharacterized protein LOC136042223 isoform X1 [Artemia franciscana]|uniref:uncharacterized protein LOC136042223 isoform X1 n=1 Tax=Artemia franciscana TaxID=6661 RepID=UPI0032DA026E